MTSCFSVVIPSRNLDNLTACIAAVRKAGETCNVVVVDGGLARRIGWWVGLGPILIIPGKQPFIFARACNQGILACNQNDVILINDDALLETTGGFTGLARPTDWGILACTTNVTGYPAQQRRMCLHERAVREVKCAAFVGVYIPRRTLTTVGLLDERFTGYGGDDVDYCLRVQQAGLKVGVSDFCFVDHAKLQSTFRPAAPGNAAPGDISESNRIGREKWGDKWPLR